MNYNFEVLTLRDINFQDPNGRQVEGIQLWLTGETDDKSWHGWEVLKLWIGKESKLYKDVYDLRRGDHVQVSFDRRGKAQFITLL